MLATTTTTTTTTTCARATHHHRRTAPTVSASVAPVSMSARARIGGGASARFLAPSARARGAALARSRGVTRAMKAPTVRAAATEVDAEKKEAVCHLRGVRMSASKIRRVLDVIRGKSYEECLIMLEFMPYRSCEPILNALFSCASNAKNNMGMNKAKLYVSECYADGGATMKRFRPRAQGRPFSIRKRTASITLKMAERED